METVTYLKEKLILCLESLSWWKSLSVGISHWSISSPYYAFVRMYSWKRLSYTNQSPYNNQIGATVVQLEERWITNMDHTFKSRCRLKAALFNNVRLEHVNYAGFLKSSTYNVQKRRELTHSVISFLLDWVLNCGEACARNSRIDWFRTISNILMGGSSGTKN